MQSQPKELHVDFVVEVHLVGFEHWVGVRGARYPYIFGVFRVQMGNLYLIVRVILTRIYLGTKADFEYHIRGIVFWKTPLNRIIFTTSCDIIVSIEVENELELSGLVDYYVQFFCCFGL